MQILKKIDLSDFILLPSAKKLKQEQNVFNIWYAATWKAFCSINLDWKEAD